MEENMKKIFILLTLLIVMLICVLNINCSNKKTQQEINIVPVEVATVKFHSFDRILHFTGNIDAWKKSDLGAQIPGKVQKIYVDAGDRVQKGDLLVQMEDAQLIQARVQYELAKKDYERMKPLLKEGSISPNQFDKIKGAYEAAKAGYDLTLANTQIRAPFSGLITNRWMDEGEVFVLMPGQTGSPAILTLMQINPAKITIRTPESDINKIKIDQPAEVKVDILPNRVFHGKISRIDPAIDPLSRTFGAEIKVENQDESLRPGMFARVSVFAGKETILAVPRSALIRQIGTGKYYAFVVENGVAKRKDVRIGSVYDELIEIREGLNENDQVVIEGQYRLKNGMQVKVVQID